MTIVNLAFTFYKSPIQVISLTFYLLIQQVLLIGQIDVGYHQQEIEADGVLDEAIWSQLEPLSGFYNYFPINDGQAELDTEVRMFQDGQYLNVAFVYHDSSAAIRVNSLKRDNYGEGFHLSDCVGMIIDPYSNQNKGYFFAVNGYGTQLDALIANYDDDNLSWDAIWQSGQSVDGTNKVYEFKIPLSAISYDSNLSEWSFQFYTRDAKIPLYTVWNKFDRGFRQYDTRFLKSLEMHDLEDIKAKRLTIIPSITSTYQKDIEKKTEDFDWTTSIDAQFALSDGLRLDATINPDFSQIDVDEQVTNLTRFNIIFPERRNFFIENSDMFTTLQLADDINPFYSRFVGATQEILMGLKLSGNISTNTRVGLLSVQSKKNDSPFNQNYTVASLKQQFNTVFNATAYLVNRQSADGLSFKNEYNRVSGLKANYLSNNRRWSGFSSYSYSFGDEPTTNGHALTVENSYNTRKLSFTTKVNSVGKDYLTDIGFVPRIHNYDALSDTTIREGYTELYQSLIYYLYPKDQSRITSIRPLNANISVFWDESGERYETNFFHNSAIFFTNGISMFVNLYHDDIRLKYAFDPLRNGQLILPGDYKNTAIRIGCNSNFTRSIYGSLNLQYGSYYNADRSRLGTTLGYRALPLFSIELNYELNNIDFDEYEEQSLHLIGLKTELFFTNKLNWTNYIQYNEQRDNFNINSRLQWEYKPLSFIYLVYTDNYNETFDHQNWGISVKLNRRLNF